MLQEPVIRLHFWKKAEKQKVVAKESEKEAAGGKRESEKIKSLHKSADDFAKKAEDLSKIVLLTQSNSLKTAQEKKRVRKNQFLA